MYLGVDIGGTKTLVAVLSQDGQVQASQKFPTPQDYEEFLQHLQQTVAALTPDKPAAACVAIPGLLDPTGSTEIALGNLPWVNEPVKADCERLLGCPVVVENDAKLAALSEANLIKDEFSKVLYITISTGIGYGLVVNGVIDQDVSDAGGHVMMVERDGEIVSWESFASGKAIVERYGKRAADIDDPAVWQELAKDFAVGLIDLIAILQPQVIVIGGGVGSHFEKFERFLTDELKKHENPMLAIPPLRQAVHAEEAVIYGCYDLLKATYGQAAS